VFVGSIFTGLMLRDLAGGFNLHRLLRSASAVLHRRRLSVRGTGVVITAIVVPVAACLTAISLTAAYSDDSGGAVSDAADLLNTKTSPVSVVEAYDSELLFMLERPYHYPTELGNALNRRTFLGHDVEIDYDPLSADPDYLVVGPHSELWRLYDTVLEDGAFRSLYENERYHIYERVR
jgi:hypothetical protein